jgi:glycosyltransferase involved in cell wall biosynthesis
MNVLLVNSLYSPNIVGGAERSTQILAEGLAAAGVRTSVVCTSDKSSTSTVNGVTVHYLKVPNLYWVKNARSASALLKPIWHTIDTDNPFTPSLLAPVLKVEKPDIVHTANLSGFSPAVWRAAKAANIPIVHTIRDMYLGCVRSAMFRNGKGCVSQCLSCKLYSVVRKRLSGLVTGVTGVSEYVLKWHLDHGYFEKAGVKQCIYNPVVTNDNGPSDRPKDGYLTFGFVGEISPHKGVELLLRAFRSLNHKNARLKIYGKPFDDTYEKRLRDKYNDPRIEFAGFADPKEIFASIDLNVLPSLCHEAFPRAVIEGYSYGVPAIVSSQGGIPEAVVENETGTVFNPGRPGDLSERMIRYLDHPELVGQMRSNCIQRAQNYATEKIVSQYVDVYEKVLK